MKEINIYKAQRIDDSLIPESVTIIIDKETPEMNYDSPTNNKKADIHYTYQAQKLSDILLRTLPGGTIDRLLICLLEHKKSILKVNY